MLKLKSWCIIFRNYYDVKSITEIPCFQKMDEEGIVLLNYELGMYIYIESNLGIIAGSYTDKFYAL